ncbi:hypothetical protein [Legionella shakespearei]|uniref:Uncharacterized protein n=1 Tax=Legionella shakespearei DSM 23087 TaxID=1122169 RepID=A0A0W0YT08_9GAMM|nr:hypothetical protein [Legionella shakespearei]KTD60012.1 hypothetical protein Lsha_1762 [Legionella shakespearei DSM 23087]
MKKTGSRSVSFSLNLPKTVDNKDGPDSSRSLPDEKKFLSPRMMLSKKQGKLITELTSSNTSSSLSDSDNSVNWPLTLPVVAFKLKINGLISDGVLSITVDNQSLPDYLLSHLSEAIPDSVMYKDLVKKFVAVILYVELDLPRFLKQIKEMVYGHGVLNDICSNLRSTLDKKFEGRYLKLKIRDKNNPERHGEALKKMLSGEEQQYHEKNNIDLQLLLLNEEYFVEHEPFLFFFEQSFHRYQQATEHDKLILVADELHHLTRLFYIFASVNDFTLGGKNKYALTWITNVSRQLVGYLQLFVLTQPTEQFLPSLYFIMDIIDLLNQEKDGGDYHFGLLLFSVLQSGPVNRLLRYEDMPRAQKEHYNRLATLFSAIGMNANLKEHLSKHPEDYGPVSFIDALFAAAAESADRNLMEKCGDILEAIILKKKKQAGVAVTMHTDLISFLKRMPEFSQDLAYELSYQQRPSELSDIVAGRSELLGEFNRWINFIHTLRAGFKNGIAHADLLNLCKGWGQEKSTRQLFVKPLFFNQEIQEPTRQTKERSPSLRDQ